MFIAISVCSVRLCLQLFVGGLVSCLGLFAYSGVQHIFALFFFVVCALCCRFLCIVRFVLPLWYSQTFIVMTARWVSLTLNTFRTRQKQCEQNHSLFAYFFFTYCRFAISLFSPFSSLSFSFFLKIK